MPIRRASSPPTDPLGRLAAIRDWVIKAFNDDLPYDQFLRQQLAGDELADYWTAYKTRRTLPRTVVDALVATGFLRCAGDTSRPDFVSIKNARGITTRPSTTL